MKPRLPWLSVLFFLAAVNLALAAAAVSPITPVGDGTYQITVKAPHKFTRNTDKLKAQALDAATQFCAKEGKQLKVVKIDEDKSLYLIGDVGHVTLTFKALAPNDPELAPAGTPVALAAPKPLTTDELKVEITKLDDMRKHGLLSDADFETLKQKLISRF